MTTISSFRNWLRTKIYQFEVTFGVYMYTHAEKFAFYSVLFLLFSLAFIAAILYLPHHVSILTGRAWYYINGEHIDVAATAREAVKDISDKLNATDGLLAKAAGALAKETVQTVAKSEL